MRLRRVLAMALSGLAWACTASAMPSVDGLASMDDRALSEVHAAGLDLVSLDLIGVTPSERQQRGRRGDRQSPLEQADLQTAVWLAPILGEQLRRSDRLAAASSETVAAAAKAASALLTGFPAPMPGMIIHLPWMLLPGATLPPKKENGAPH